MSETLDSSWIRVSSILNMLPTLGPDQKWGYPMYQIDPEVLQRAADRGTAVHKAIADHLQGRFSVLYDEEAGYFESYLKWEEEVKVKCLASERRLFHPSMKLTGCIDMIACLGGEVETPQNTHIIDFKCTSVADHKKWKLQGAFYEFLCGTSLWNISKTVLFVQLDAKGGMPKVHPYEITNRLSYEAIHLYHVYMYLTQS